jgi:phage repressor protein C with HTH and peptisase S24 domain
MEHTEIWGALDALAARHRLTASGLAKAAGLDPTTFNKSKRTSPDGRPRWPSSESVTRALEAVGATYADFAALVGAGGRPPAMTLPIIPLRTDPELQFDERGRPICARDTISFPGQDLEGSFACEVLDQSCTTVYRAGDILVLQPEADLRRGDRVVVRLVSGAFSAALLGSRTDQSIELAPFDPNLPATRVSTNDVAWIARILWASQ